MSNVIQLFGLGTPTRATTPRPKKSLRRQLPVPPKTARSPLGQEPIKPRVLLAPVPERTLEEQEATKALLDEISAMGQAMEEPWASTEPAEAFSEESILEELTETPPEAPLRGVESEAENLAPPPDLGSDLIETEEGPLEIGFTEEKAYEGREEETEDLAPEVAEVFKTRRQRKRELREAEDKASNTEVEPQ